MSNFSPKTSNHLTIYGNVFINDKIKFNALKFTLPQWLNYWNAPCIIRVRGKFSSEVFEFCKGFSSVQCVQGSDFIQWRRQTLWDVKSIKTKYIMVYLEDHMLAPSAPNAKVLIREMYENEVNVFQYSWFQQYKKIIGQFSNIAPDFTSVYIDINKNNLNSFLKLDYRWIISLSSIFEHELFSKILRSGRPYIRTKDPKAPYDVEQTPDSVWYLPIKFGVCKSELGISLDDDNGIVGTSAISRNLYIGERSAWAEYHDGRLSTINLARVWKTKFYGKKTIYFLPLKVRFIIAKLVYWPSYINYSIMSLIFTCMDSTKAKFLKLKRNTSK